MRKDAIELEESRLHGIEKIEDYPWFKDRHRVFPQIFEDRGHRRVIDTSAGVGCVGKRIQQGYPADLLCNDISPTSLKILSDLGIPNTCFDIDDENAPFPLEDGSFDAVISLVTVEHLMHPDHFIKECRRILSDGGYLYISTPNYASLSYVLGLIFNGKSFHDPLAADSAYEFYAHVRYFTYRTLLEMTSSYGFALEAVYIALPELNSDYLALKSRSPFKAFIHRYSRWWMYHLLPPRWTAEPILCFQKASANARRKVRKVVL